MTKKKKKEKKEGKYGFLILDGMGLTFSHKRY